MSKYDLALRNPIMNAAGVLGFTPARRYQFKNSLGAFVTNPISLQPRQPANPPEYINFPGGFLIHTGYPNPGLSHAIRQYAAKWAVSDIPIILHVLCSDLTEFEKMRNKLEALQGIEGIEISLPPGSDPGMVMTLIQNASIDLPIFLRFPLDEAVYLARQVAKYRDNFNIVAISLGPPRGTLPGNQQALVSGRLYGPALFPITLAVTGALHKLDLPVIAAGGIYHAAHVHALLDAGATAVQLDTVLWRGGFDFDINALI